MIGMREVIFDQWLYACEVYVYNAQEDAYHLRLLSFIGLGRRS